MTTLVLLVAQAGGAGGPASEQRGDDRRDAEAALTAQLLALPVRGGLRIDPVPAGSTAEVLAVLGERLSAATGPTAIVSADVTAEDAALLRILDDPSLPVAGLVRSGAGHHPVATHGSRVLSAATTHHPLATPDADAAGIIYVAANLVTTAGRILATAGKDIADTEDTVGPVDRIETVDTIDMVDLALATLARAADLPVMVAVRAEPFRAERGREPAPAVGADPVADADRDADRDREARTAARPGDGWYSTFVLRRLSRRLTPIAVRWGVPANVVTAVSALIGIGGAALFAVGSYPALIAGALLLQVSILLDCVDGEIARATRTRSAFGGWLDAATDRVKEYAALAGLALAGHHLWAVAGAAMVVQTVRHVQDYSFDKGLLAERRAAFRDTRPMTDTGTWHWPAGATPGPEAMTGSVGLWARRLIRMPIGERWLVLCLAALLDRPWLGLWAYLGLAVLAEGWALLGALRRSRYLGHSSATLRRTLAAYRDDGILAVVTGRRAPAGAAGWLLPPLVTLLEGAAVVATTDAVAPRWTAAAFGWFAVVAWHRYDGMYGRADKTASAVGWLGGGWLVRIAVVLIAAAAGGLPVVLLVGICWLGLVYLPESLWAGLRTARRGTGAGISA